MPEAVHDRPTHGEPVQALLEEARSLFDAETAAIFLLDETGRHLDTYAAVGLERTVRERVRVRVGEGFVSRIVLERHPLVIDDAAAVHVINPVLRGHGIRSIVGVPLISAGGLLGTLHVGSMTRGRFDEEGVRRLGVIAEQMARLIRLRIESENHAATLALQRSLLPSTLPRIPGLDIAARYLHAAGSLGGDWYDVFPLPRRAPGRPGRAGRPSPTGKDGAGGRVGLVMGDVAGHGFPAAVVMGRLRSALRAYALEYDDPAEVLHHLDVKIQHFEPGVFATVLYAVSDYPYDVLRVSSAGHPAPLVTSAEGCTTVADVAPDLPLGAIAEAPRRTTRVPVEKGSAVLIYTDGLVERRPPGRYRDELARLVGMVKVEAAVDSCTRVLDAMFRNTPVEDDTAILVMRRLGEIPAPAFSGASEQPMGGHDGS